VFVDDSPANVAAAIAFGFNGLHFSNARRLREDLVSLGLLAEPSTIDETGVPLGAALRLGGRRGR